MTGDNQNGSARGDSEAQRERLIDAFTRIASERGYVKTTVQDVATAAGLSRAEFFEHFSSKHQCLSAAYDAFVDRMIEEVRRAADDGEGWPERVKEAVAAALGFIAETATRARFFAVEAPVAGPVMFERRAAAMEKLVFQLRSGREQYPMAADLPERMEFVLVAGAASVVGSILLPEEHTRLPSLEGELVEILLTPYVGRDEARRVAY